MSPKADMNLNVRHYIDSAKIGRTQWVTFVLCFWLTMLEGFDTSLMGFIAPQMKRDGLIGASEMSAALTIGLLGLFVGAIGGGIMADRLGRKKAVLLSIVWFGLGCCATSMIETGRQLLCWRFITGLGIGAAMPGIAGLVSEWAAVKSRASFLTSVFCGFLLGGAVAGLLTGAAMAAIGWRGMLIIGGVLPVLAAVIFWLLAADSPVHMVVLRRSPARIGATLRRAFPHDDFEGKEFTSPEKPVNKGRLSMLFSHEHRAATLAIWCTQFLAFFVFYQLSSWLPGYIASTGIVPDVAAHIASHFHTGALIGAIVCVALTRRVAPSKVAACGYALAAVVMIMIASATSVDAFSSLIYLAGAFVGGPIICMNALSAIVYPTALRGTGSGAAHAASRMGSIIGVAAVAIPLKAGFAFPQIIGSLSIPLFGISLALFVLTGLITRRLRTVASA
ncbi:MFS transporter [Paraburkholderia caledonica]|uniref:AAHS family 4-hydroxybenzoate transporter-like MFS transporter n=1 Tax=Paraburkholderia caledonica TaxID=134536 RepID=A0AB73IL13_9BURK|nr:AAHS family 4-hydroxybenzoate transporter-like MFS transporter [Paraburkholderia caledonica]